MRYENDRILIFSISQGVWLLSKRQNDPILDLTLKSNRKVPTVLGHAVFVTRLEQTTDHIRVISICPYSCLRNVLSEVVLGPEHLSLSRACAFLCVIAFGGGIR